MTKKHLPFHAGATGLLRAYCHGFMQSCSHGFMQSVLTEVFTLPQVETCLVVAGGRLSNIVSSRKNLHFSGTTSGTSLMEVFKNDLRSVPTLATVEKHSMMQGARVKDDSRATTGAKGFLIANHVFVNAASVSVHVCAAM